MAEIDDPASVIGGAAVQALPHQAQYQQTRHAFTWFNDMPMDQTGSSGMVSRPRTKLNVEEAKDDRPFIQKLFSAPTDLLLGLTEGILEDPLLNFVSPIHWTYN